MNMQRVGRSSGCLIVIAAAAWPLLVPADTYLWQVTGGVNQAWNETANWTPAGFPNAAGDVADLRRDLTAALAINLGQDVTVGQLLMGDTLATGYATTINAGQTLTIDNNGTPGLIRTESVAGSADRIKPTVVLNGLVSVLGGWKMAIDGEIGGSGGILMRRDQSFGSLLGARTYTGPTIIQDDFYKLTGSSVAKLTDFYIYVTGGVNPGGRLELGQESGASPNADRIGDGARASMRGGTLLMYGSSAAALAEQMGEIAFDWGESAVELSDPSGHGTTLRAAGLSRLGHGTGLIQGFLGAARTNSLGLTTRLLLRDKDDVEHAPAMVGGGGATATSKSIVPYLSNRWVTNTFDTFTYTFVTYGTTTGLVPLDPGADFFQADPAANGQTIMDAAATDNVRLVGILGDHGNDTTLADYQEVTDDKTVNALLVHGKDNNSGYGNYNVMIAEGKRLTVTSGGVIHQNLNSDGGDGMNLNFRGGTLDFGAREGLFWTGPRDNIRVESDLTGSAGITFARGKYLSFGGTPKSYTGDTTVNLGELQTQAWYGNQNFPGQLPAGTTLILRNMNGGYINGTIPTARVTVYTGGTCSEQISGLAGCGRVDLCNVGKMTVGAASTQVGSNATANQLLLDGGTITPGDVDLDDIQSSVIGDLGSLQVDGTFRHDSGTLRIVVGSDDDVASLKLIESEAGATIGAGADLDVVLLGNYVPADGQNWDILVTNGGSVNGTYAPAHITDNAPGSFSTTAANGKLTLHYSAAVPPGPTLIKVR